MLVPSLKRGRSSNFFWNLLILSWKNKIKNQQHQATCIIIFKKMISRKTLTSSDLKGWSFGLIPLHLNFNEKRVEVSLAREKREWARWRSGICSRSSGSERERNSGNCASSCSTLCRVRFSDSMVASGTVTPSISLAFTIFSLFSFSRQSPEQCGLLIFANPRNPIHTPI